MILEQIIKSGIKLYRGIRKGNLNENTWFCHIRNVNCVVLFQGI